MKAADAVLQIKVPRNKTALMQHLQLLVMNRHCWWCGGAISREKLRGFVTKMATQYPITRSTRGRVYDRTRGRASVHLIVFPVGENRALWWLLSSAGKGGLNDASAPDSHVAKHALTAAGHIIFADYILLYAHKKDARKVKDAKTGKEKLVFKDMSTWTWKLTDAAFNEVKASIERAVGNLDFGHEGGEGRSPSGVLGILAFQRARPLFSGVRTQVIALHRHAEERWGRVQKKWQGTHSELVLREGGRAGRLRPLKEIMSSHLPKMTRIAVYGNAPITIGGLMPEK